MENREILLTKEATDNIDETIEILINAAQDIATSSEQDFNKIKSKKWYTRLWEIVTFSKDNEKIRARGVGNLAKLNEIIMKAIVLISRQSKEIAERVCESLMHLQNLQQDVDDLYAQQIKITETILSIKRGFCTEAHFDELAENQRDIIFAILMVYAGNKANSYTQKLLSIIRKYARRTYDDVDYEIIESELSPSAQKMLYNLLHGYTILLEDVCADEDQEIFEYFALSPKMKSKIRDQVQSEILKFGKDGYISTFDMRGSEEDFSVYDEDIEWIFSEAEFGEEDECAPEEECDSLEEVRIDHIINIACGQVLNYTQKEIHMGSLINCSGRLELDRCVIVHNKNASADEITLSSGGEIYATNCTFICKGIDENAFITLTENCNAVFDKCLFIDCTYFIKAGYRSNLTINNCELHNCMVFGDCEYANSVELRNSKLTADNTFGWEKRDMLEALFTVRNAEECIVENIIASATEPTVAWDWISISEGTVRQCSFYGIHGCAIRARVIEDCVFESCNGAGSLVLTDSSFGQNKCLVKACIFDNCTDIICADRNTLITQCTFANCFDSLVRSDISGTGIELSYCEITNYTNRSDGRKELCGICLNVARKQSLSSITKCIFDGIKINEGFLIGPHITEKLSGSLMTVSDCDFRNCRTNRQSGKIIKTYDFYYGLFDKRYDELAVRIINCRGLDLVECSDFETGAKIDHVMSAAVVTKKSSSGAFLGTVAAGIIGGPLVGATAAIASVIAKKNQQKQDAISAEARKE